jgi:hypothetical protein
LELKAKATCRKLTKELKQKNSDYCKITNTKAEIIIIKKDAITGFSDITCRTQPMHHLPSNSLTCFERS